MSNFLSFKESYNIVKKLKLKNINEWRKWIKKNKKYNIPYNPDTFYKDSGWVNWKHFLNHYGESYKIIYEKEKKFKSCKNKRKLPFDFYLPKYNLCIEYDGQHHYQIVSKYGGECFLKKVKKNDKIKTDWCLLNNVKLLRIPYNKKNKICEILKKELYL